MIPPHAMPPRQGFQHGNYRPRQHIYTTSYLLIFLFLQCCWLMMMIQANEGVDILNTLNMFKCHFQQSEATFFNHYDDVCLSRLAQEHATIMFNRNKLLTSTDAYKVKTCNNREFASISLYSSNKFATIVDVLEQTFTKYISTFDYQRPDGTSTKYLAAIIWRDNRKVGCAKVGGYYSCLFQPFAIGDLELNSENTIARAMPSQTNGMVSLMHYHHSFETQIQPIGTLSDEECQIKVIHSGATAMDGGSAIGHSVKAPVPAIPMSANDKKVILSTINTLRCQHQMQPQQYNLIYNQCLQHIAQIALKFGDMWRVQLKRFPNRLNNDNGNNNNNNDDDSTTDNDDLTSSTSSTISITSGLDDTRCNRMGYVIISSDTIPTAWDLLSTAYTQYSNDYTTQRGQNPLSQWVDSTGVISNAKWSPYTAIIWESNHYIGCAHNPIVGQSVCLLQPRYNEELIQQTNNRNRNNNNNNNPTYNGPGRVIQYQRRDQRHEIANDAIGLPYTNMIGLFDTNVHQLHRNVATIAQCGLRVYNWLDTITLIDDDSESNDIFDFGNDDNNDDDDNNNQDNGNNDQISNTSPSTTANRNKPSRNNNTPKNNNNDNNNNQLTDDDNDGDMIQDDTTTKNKKKKNSASSLSSSHSIFGIGSFFAILMYFQYV